MVSGVKRILFNNRDGHTVLSASELRGLKLAHITNLRELDEAEQTNINQGLIWLETKKNEDYLNESFLLKLHKKLFGEVWKWAGTYRKSEKNIGIDAWRVPTEMHKLFADTQYWIKNQSYKNWSELLTHFHHRLVSIHPFPNGNGRFSRIYTNHLCFKNQKIPPTWLYWLPPEKRRSLYINALRQADEKKFDSLIEFFSKQTGCPG